MPLFQAAGGIHCFAHVPRCGGSAVEHYLAARFGPLGFLDRKYLRVSEAERWSRSSPQHLPAAALARLLPQGWIRSTFAVVRHPEERVRSVFLYQRDIERKLPADIEFDAWLSDLPERRAAEPYWLDNHPRPMTELVPNDARIFRLEDGLTAVVSWLDEIEGVRRGPETIAKKNDYTTLAASRGREPDPGVYLTESARRQINQLYAADFERFGYVPREGDELLRDAEGTGADEGDSGACAS